MVYMLSLCVTKMPQLHLLAILSFKRMIINKEAYIAKLQRVRNCLVTQSLRFNIVQCRCRAYIYPGVK